MEGTDTVLHPLAQDDDSIRYGWRSTGETGQVPSGFMQGEKYLKYTTHVWAVGLLSKRRQARDDNLHSLIPSLLPTVWLSLTENKDLAQIKLELLVVGS